MSVSEGLLEMYSQCVQQVPVIQSRCSPEDLAHLGGLHRQATFGDWDRSSMPIDIGTTDSQTRAKFKEWVGLKGTSKKAAMLQYIRFVARVYPEWLATMDSKVLIENGLLQQPMQHAQRQQQQQQQQQQQEQQHKHQPAVGRSHSVSPAPPHRDVSVIGHSSSFSSDGLRNGSRHHHHHHSSGECNGIAPADLCADSGAEIVKSGLLYKKRDVFNGWRPRHFMLDVGRGVLTYSLNDDGNGSGKDLRGYFRLRGARVAREQQPVFEKRMLYPLMLIAGSTEGSAEDLRAGGCNGELPPPKKGYSGVGGGWKKGGRGKQQQRVWKIAAESKNDADAWCAALQGAISRVNGSPGGGSTALAMSDEDGAESFAEDGVGNGNGYGARGDEDDDDGADDDADGVVNGYDNAEGKEDGSKDGEGVEERKDGEIEEGRKEPMEDDEDRVVVVVVENGEEADGTLNEGDDAAAAVEAAGAAVDLPSLLQEEVEVQAEVELSGAGDHHDDDANGGTTNSTGSPYGGDDFITIFIGGEQTLLPKEAGLGIKLQLEADLSRAFRSVIQDSKPSSIWEDIGFRDGVQCYRSKSFPGSSSSACIRLKGVAFMPASVGTILAFLNDEEEFTACNEKARSSQCLLELPNRGFIRRLLFKRVWPTLAREGIFATWWRVLDRREGSVISASVSISDERWPVTEHHVRTELYYSGFILRPMVSDEGVSGTEVTYVNYADLKGASLPQALVNVFVKDEPLLLAKIRRAIVAGEQAAAAEERRYMGESPHLLELDALLASIRRERNGEDDDDDDGQGGGGGGNVGAAGSVGGVGLGADNDGYVDRGGRGGGGGDGGRLVGSGQTMMSPGSTSGDRDGRSQGRKRQLPGTDFQIARAQSLPALIPKGLLSGAVLSVALYAVFTPALSYLEALGSAAVALVVSRALLILAIKVLAKKVAEEVAVRMHGSRLARPRLFDGRGMRPGVHVLRFTCDALKLHRYLQRLQRIQRGQRRQMNRDTDGDSCSSGLSLLSGRSSKWRSKVTIMTLVTKAVGKVMSSGVLAGALAGTAAIPPAGEGDNETLGGGGAASGKTRQNSGAERHVMHNGVGAVAAEGSAVNNGVSTSASEAVSGDLSGTATKMVTVGCIPREVVAGEGTSARCDDSQFSVTVNPCDISVETLAHTMSFGGNEAMMVGGGGGGGRGGGGADANLMQAGTSTSATEAVNTVLTAFAKVAGLFGLVESDILLKYLSDSASGGVFGNVRRTDCLVIATPVPKSSPAGSGSLMWREGEREHEQREGGEEWRSAAGRVGEAEDERTGQLRTGMATGNDDADDHDDDSRGQRGRGRSSGRGQGSGSSGNSSSTSSSSSLLADVNVAKLLDAAADSLCYAPMTVIIGGITSSKSLMSDRARTMSPPLAAAAVAISAKPRPLVNIAVVAEGRVASLSQAQEFADHLKRLLNEPELLE